MDNENLKCVIIIDENIPLGIAANTAAILGISLGKILPDIVGCDTADKTSNVHCGIIKFPVPILSTDYKKIAYIRNKLYDDELTVVDFSTLAQSCKTYDEYIDKMKTADTESLDYIGIAICGNKKKINKLTGNMSLLK